MKNFRNIRLYVGSKLFLSNELILTEKQSHYLCNVMRCKKDDIIKCFNPTSGEFFCQITLLDKKKTVIKIFEKNKDPEKQEDLWLIFSPLKKDKTDFVIEKAVELGVSKIIPVITHYTNSDKVKIDRFVSQAIEAAEQCGRISIPDIIEAIKLDDLLSSWDDSRTLFFMDERRNGNAILPLFKKSSSKMSAILIGPEGGFSDEEAFKINECKFVKNVSLGPRILRAETAALASLAIWQATVGDWHKGEIDEDINS